MAEKSYYNIEVPEGTVKVEGTGPFVEKIRGALAAVADEAMRQALSRAGGEFNFRANLPEGEQPEGGQV